MISPLFSCSRNRLNSDSYSRQNYLDNLTQDKQGQLNQEYDSDKVQISPLLQKRNSTLCNQADRLQKSDQNYCNQNSSQRRGISQSSHSEYQPKSYNQNEIQIQDRRKSIHSIYPYFSTRPEAQRGPRIGGSGNQLYNEQLHPSNENLQIHPNSSPFHKQPLFLQKTTFTSNKPDFIQLPAVIQNKESSPQEQQRSENQNQDSEGFKDILDQSKQNLEYAYGDSHRNKDYQKIDLQSGHYIHSKQNLTDDSQTQQINSDQIQKNKKRNKSLKADEQQNSFQSKRQKTQQDDNKIKFQQPMTEITKEQSKQCPQNFVNKAQKKLKQKQNNQNLKKNQISQESVIILDNKQRSQKQTASSNRKLGLNDESPQQQKRDDLKQEDMIVESSQQMNDDSNEEEAKIEQTQDQISDIRTKQDQFDQLYKKYVENYSQNYQDQPQIEEQKLSEKLLYEITQQEINSGFEKFKKGKLFNKKWQDIQNNINIVIENLIKKIIEKCQDYQGCKSIRGKLNKIDFLHEDIKNSSCNVNEKLKDAIKEVNKQLEKFNKNKKIKTNENYDKFCQCYNACFFWFSILFQEKKQIQINDWDICKILSYIKKFYLVNEIPKALQKFIYAKYGVKSINKKSQNYEDQKKYIEENFELQPFITILSALKQLILDILAKQRNIDSAGNSRDKNKKYKEELEQKNAELEKKNAELEQKKAELEKKNAELEQKNAELEKRMLNWSKRMLN